MSEGKIINELPKAWRRTCLKDVSTKIVVGYVGPVTQEIVAEDGVKFLSTTHIGENEFIPHNIRLVRRSFNEKNKKSQVIPGDIIIARHGDSGKACIIPDSIDVAQVSNAVILRPNPEVVTAKFICYRLNAERQRMQKSKVGGVLQVVNTKSMESFQLDIPSIEEQQQIVSKIEELFSELDKGIEELKTAQQQLKVYRQAVLKWAFEGKLTNENVKEGELPEGWSLQPLGNYIKHIGAGKSFRCEERPPRKGEIGIIKVSSVTWGFFNENESKTCFSADMLNESYLVKKGDFLFSRANTIELIGACVIVQSITKKLMLSDKILRFTFNENVSKKYVLYFLRSRKGRQEIERLSTGNQESMKNIGQEKIKQIEMPITDLEEQEQIIQEVESRLSVCDKIEETIIENLNQAEALRQSILKRAFEGNLSSPRI